MIGEGEKDDRPTQGGQLPGLGFQKARIWPLSVLASVACTVRYKSLVI